MRVMMEDKKKTKWPYDEEDDRELFDDLYAVASSTEDVYKRQS